MKLFKVSYSGFWLGGRAIVFARSAKHALKQVQDHKETANFKDATVEELEQKGVIYNDNGDY